MSNYDAKQTKELARRFFDKHHRLTFIDYDEKTRDSLKDCFASDILRNPQTVEKLHELYENGNL